MSETTNTPTTRRAMLGSAAGFTVLAGIAAATIAKPDTPAVEVPPASRGDDAELIAIGREAAALLDQRKLLAVQFWALPAGPAKGDELEAVANAMEPIDGRLDALTNHAMTLRSTSRKAMAVKARLIGHDLYVCHAHGGEMAFEAMEPSQRLAWSLVEDLVRAGDV